jgi:sugar lactone lactonase YvrE
LDQDLTESQLETYVEQVARVGPSDGICFGNEGAIYLTSIEFNAIRKYDDINGVSMVFQNDALKWPDCIDITNDNILYVTTSQLHLGENRTDPYRIFKIDLNQ